MPSPIGQDFPVMSPGIYSFAPLGYEQITLSGSTVIDLTNGGTFTIPPSARMALIAVSVAKVRWRDDGTNPTTAVGMPVDGTTNTLEFQYTGDLTAIKFVAVSGSPVLDVSFYR